MKVTIINPSCRGCPKSIFYRSMIHKEYFVWGIIFKRALSRTFDGEKIRNIHYVFPTEFFQSFFWVSLAGEIGNQ